VKKTTIGIILTCVLAAAVVTLYLMFSGPRMRTQLKITPYQAVLPMMPAGVIPVVAEQPAVPSEASVAQLRNPVPHAREAIEMGRVYYGYYCSFCHGIDGRGDGPVGRSYVPVPTDLTRTRTVNLSDGALYRAMLAGVGHEPVLGYVIDTKMHWYLVRYMRHLQTLHADANDLHAPHVVQ
jgi:hypothetical protein